MKKFNIIGLLLAFVGVLSLASCEHQYADYTPGEQDKGMGVYFPSTAAINVTDADTSFDIVVARVKSDAAASVTLRSEAKDAEGTLSELFTIPTSVDFAAGATEANLTITFDGSKLEIGKKYGVSIGVLEYDADAAEKIRKSLKPMADHFWMFPLFQTDGKEYYLLADTSYVLKELRYRSPMLQSYHTRIGIYGQQGNKSYEISFDMLCSEL